MTIKWNEDQDRTITTMYADGYHYTDIAVKLFNDASKRGAVAGRCKRLRAAGVIIKRVGNIIRPPAAGSRLHKRRPPPQPIVKPTERITVDNIRNNVCRWPFGDPRDTKNFYFCGVSPLGWKTYSDKESPYCSEHTAIAYQPPGSRKIQED